MRVDVTQEDIEKGIQRSCQNCPVALAIARATGSEKIRAGRLTIQVNGVSVNTPNAASEFMGDFDGKLPVAPFSFELEVS